MVVFLQVTDLRRGLNIVHRAANEASWFFVVNHTDSCWWFSTHDSIACYTFQVRGSAKLKRIMQTILSLGNALNHGTARGEYMSISFTLPCSVILEERQYLYISFLLTGSAIGFRLDSLLKLTDTRSRNSKMTLMHYLCKVRDFSIVSHSLLLTSILYSWHTLVFSSLKNVSHARIYRCSLKNFRSYLIFLKTWWAWRLQQR